MKFMPDDDYIGGKEEDIFPTGNEQIIVSPRVSGDGVNTKALLYLAGAVAILYFLSKRKR